MTDVLFAASKISMVMPVNHVTTTNRYLSVLSKAGGFSTNTVVANSLIKSSPS